MTQTQKDKYVIKKAHRYHNNGKILPKVEGAMFLSIILNEYQYSSWTKKQYLRWGYLIHPYYITSETYNEIGAIA